MTNDLFALQNCTCCPRECNVDRTSTTLGVCGTGAALSIGSICAHRGEEPVISGETGICNIFFTGCNLNCIFCQNHQISRPGGLGKEADLTLTELISQVEQLLDSGCHAVGFVSPSHVVPQVRAIIAALKNRDPKPVLVYNTNSYEKVETIRSFAGEVDVWLPDLKYMDDDLARRYSHAPEYSAIACAAIREMFHQKGAEIWLDDEGRITSGLIIRHLVLPGQVENSKQVLRWIAEELSPGVHLSLMSQYQPTPAVADHPELGRTLRPEEYEQVLEEFDRLGFYRGWQQELASAANYQPDFNRDHPFESRSGETS